jgi:hypothetical protein
MNKGIVRKMGFGEEVDLVHQGKCPLCRKEVDVREFRDGHSVREFLISRMCKSCQDGVFENNKEVER